MTVIDKILTDAGVKNNDLVSAFPGKLTHKVVQKARTGKRPLSHNMQIAVTAALNEVIKPKTPYKREALFPEESSETENDASSSASHTN